MDPYTFPGEDNEENELYELLNATTISNSGFDSNLRDCGVGFGGFDNDDVEDGYPNTGSLLSGTQLEADVFTDVYRSVGAIDFASQHQEGVLGESHLDEPIEYHSYVASRKREEKMEVLPRVFHRLRLEHTHMYVACPLNDFVGKLDRMFKEHCVDFTFEESGCLWRAMYYPKEPTPAVDFRVYVNSCPNLGSNRFLIEFVRRSGCGMAFNDLFSTIRGTLIAMKLITKVDGEFVQQVEDLPCPVNFDDICWENKAISSDQEKLLLVRSTSSASSASSLNGLDSIQDDFEDLSVGCSDEELFAPLVDMSKSSFEDVHVQGLALVAHECAKGNANRLISTSPDVVKLLLERISDSQNTEVQRNCCVALCEIASESQLVSTLVENNVANVLSNVAAQSFNPATAEIQRQAAQTLANMCCTPQGIKAVYEAVKDKFETFKQLEGQDTRLTDSITNVRKALETAC